MEYDNRNEHFAVEFIERVTELKGRLSDAQAEDFLDLLSLSYKEGYIDGISDTLFYCEK